MGYVTITFRDTGEQLHFGDNNPNVPRVNPGPLAKPAPKGEWHSPNTDPEVREPGDFSYTREL